MAGLSLANVKTILDSLAQQAVNIQTNGFDANATGYTNNRATILAAATSSDFTALATCSDAFSRDVGVSIVSLYQSRYAALNTHLGGLNAYLLANDTRVHPALRDILGWLTLTPAVFFQTPVLAGATKLGHFLLSGVAAGTFTDGAAVDPLKFGKAWLRVKVTAPGGGIATTVGVTIVGKKSDGSTQTLSVNLIGGSSAVGTYYNVGSLGVDADHFVDVTSVTVTGGEATDAFDIESRLERTIAL